MLSLIRLSLLSIIIIYASEVFSEDSRRGRLPDGTPFRTDAQGTQIVDYIAELEQSVEYLEDRVKTLESDLSSSKETIDRLNGLLARKNVETKTKLYERDLEVPKASMQRSFPPTIRLETSPLGLAKKEFSRDLAVVEQLQDQRQKLFEEYKNSDVKRAVSFKLTPPLSRKGNSIVTLKEVSTKATELSQLYALKVELLQIRKIIADDIALVRRLSK